MNTKVSVCTHPIWLLARTDTDVVDLYHSFYMMNFQGNEFKVLDRIPSEKDAMDDIESGLKLFLIDIIEHKSICLNWGTFSVTTSVGLRFYASWRLVEANYFVAVKVYL